MDPIIKELGENVRKYRKQKNLTTAELAQEVGVSAGLINNLENAKNDIFRINLLLKLLNQLDIPLEKLIPSILNITQTKFSDSKEQNKLICSINVTNMNFSNEEKLIVEQHCHLMINAYLLLLQNTSKDKSYIDKLNKYILDTIKLLESLN